ncbi:MAG: 4-hydroxybenzoate 3-monooxygenase [Solirubrobacteraceae bacterium]
MSETQVAIVGAGPAGLLLAHLLHQEGIESVVLEARSRDYVEQRVRAGVLEHDTVQTLTSAGVGDRLQREGLVHEGIELRFGGRGHRIDLHALTGGRTITVYGQQEVVKDLIAARLEAGGELLFEVGDTSVHDLESERPAVRYTHGGAEHELRCDVIAGCDGFHGICRPSIPEGALTVYEREYPFAWLGILARARPSSEELIYANHERGFALHSMRSPEITRLYLQCEPDEDLDEWPDERIWEELQTRFALDEGFSLNEGEIFERGVTPMRSFVVEPMCFGRLFLAGDAAHIVPPTGAKGLNVAVADVRVLAQALAGFYRDGDDNGLDAYSEHCLRRVWRVQHFSWFMTSMLHRPAGQDPFEAQLQHAQLQYVCASRAAATTLAENYVGLEHV